MTERTLRIGMISWAHVHAEFRSRAISEIPGAEIVAIADDDRARGESAAKRFGVPDFTTDWRVLVERDDLDLVMVHSANDEHRDQVIAVAESGKHVFCEKPIATSAEDSAAMVRAVETAGVDGTAAFVSRFSKEASALKRIVDSGELGEVLFTRSLIGLAGVEEIGCPPDMVRWMCDPQKGGGGAWIDEGAHGVDLVRWLVGDITEISAMQANRSKPNLEVEDIALANVRYESGAIGQISTVWSLVADIGMRNHLEIYGTKGTVIMRATDPFPRVEVYRAGESAPWRGWTTPHIEADSSEPHDYSSWPPHSHHYKREVASYLQRALADERPYGPTFRDGLACSAVLEKGYEAAADGATHRVPSVGELVGQAEVAR